MNFINVVESMWNFIILVGGEDSLLIPDSRLRISS